MPKCEICGLKTSRVEGKKRTFMAQFPLDEARCKQWVKITGKEDLAYVPIEKLHQLKYICGNHFLLKDFKKKKTQLRKRAVPCMGITAEPLNDKILSDFPLHLPKKAVVVQHLQFDATNPSTPQCSKGSETEILHKFPHPEKERNRFWVWISSIGGNLISLNETYIYLNYRVCHLHFDPKYYTRSKYLAIIAVPTLLLKENSTKQPEVADINVSRNNLKEGVSSATTTLTSKENVTGDHTYTKRLHVDHSYCFSSGSETDPRAPRCDTYGPKKPPPILPPYIKGIITVPSKVPTKWSKPEEANDENIESNDSQDDQDDQENEEQDVPKVNYCIDEDDHCMQDDVEKDLPFSWHKCDVIECDEESEVPVLDGDVTAQELSLYEPSEPVPQKDSGLKTASGPSSGHSGLFSCNVCHETICGPFRYSCVQCGDFDLCRACEANDHHADHFVLRVPAIKPEGEVRSLLRSIRQVLASAIAPSDDAIDLLKDEVKQEIEDEPEMEQDVELVLSDDPLEQPLHQHDLELDSPEIECVRDYYCNEQEAQRFRKRVFSQKAPSLKRLANSHSLFNQCPSTSRSSHSLPKRSSQYESRSLRVKPLSSITNTPRLLNFEPTALSNFITTPEDQTFTFQVGTDFRIPETEAKTPGDLPMQRYCVVSSTSNVQQLVRTDWSDEATVESTQPDEWPKVMVVDEEGQLIKVQSDTTINIKDLRVVMERLPVVTFHDPFASD